MSYGELHGLDAVERHYQSGAAAAQVAQAKAAQAAHEPEINRANDRIAIIAETLSRVRETLGKTADDVFGAGLASSAGENAPRPVRSGRIGNLHDALDNLDTLACAVSAQAERFNRL